MRQLGIIIVSAMVTGITAFAGCGSSTSSGTTGTGATTTTHQSGSSSSGHGGSSSSSSSSASSSSGSSMLACTIPTPLASKGSCVGFAGGADAGEQDAGLDDAGNASLTVCNPVTNAGCTGSDVCGPDFSSHHYYCQPSGTPSNVAICGDCTAQAATCGAGGLCFSFDGKSYACAQMCCTDADCGTGAKCDMNIVNIPLPSNVGICDK